MYIISITDINGDRIILNLSQVVTVTKGLVKDSYVIYCRNGHNISISPEIFDKLFTSGWVKDRIK